MSGGLPADGGRTTDDDAWAPTTRPATGTLDLGLTGYTDLVEVARGGDSVVYRARQLSPRRDVAIKVIDVADPATLARFERELEITVMLGRQHPHVVTVLDTSTTSDGRACLVMDFHDLGSLHDRLSAHGPLPVSEVVGAGTAVADALAFAHSHGVIHRDVKPQNVLVLPTSYVLTDFGIARHADSGRTASLERFSYRHASPQVLDGLEPTVADDVWSLGSTLSTLLDGRAPFAADDPDEDTALAYLRRVRTGHRRPWRRDDVPAELRAVVDRCLDPDPAHRFATADEVHDALRAVRTESRVWAPGSEVAGDPTDGGSPDGGGPDGVDDGPAIDGGSPDGGDTDAGSPDGGGSDGAGPHGVDAGPATDAGSSDGTRAVASPAEAPPPRREPARHAPSAIADAGWAPVADDAPDHDPDAAATGLAPAGETAEPGPAREGDAGTPATPPDSAAARRRWPALLGFVAGAVLLGSGIGTATVLLTNRGEPETPPPIDQTAFPVPPLDDDVELPEEDPLDVDLSDPAYAPADVVLVDNGTSITASWADPTDGGITVAVVDATDPANPVALESIAPGVTTRTVEGVDPDVPEVCLLLLGIDVSDATRWGASEVSCVQR